MISRTIKFLIFKYPVQAFLFLYNGGVFTYLALVGNRINQQLPFQTDGITKALSNFFQSSFFTQFFSGESMSTFFQNGPYSWLIISILLSIIYSFIGTVFRIIITLVVIVVGLYFIYIFSKANGYIA